LTYSVLEVFICSVFRLLKLLSSISTAIFPEGSKPPSSRYVGSTWWDSVEGSKIKPQAIVDKSTVLLPNQLRLAVEVLFALCLCCTSILLYDLSLQG